MPSHPDHEESGSFRPTCATGYPNRQDEARVSIAFNARLKPLDKPQPAAG